MVGAASGCWAMELRADETDFPSPRAGIMHPIAVARPAVTMDATAIIVVLSILTSYSGFYETEEALYLVSYYKYE